MLMISHIRPALLFKLPASTQGRKSAQRLPGRGFSTPAEHKSTYFNCFLLEAERWLRQLLAANRIYNPSKL
jgi:hypothetical protein